MGDTKIARTSVVIGAGAERVWAALTSPELIKRYLFGTEASSTWQVGAPITYRGVWEGKPYEDKGKILDLVPNKRLVSTYWSSMGGKPDRPENYNIVTYELAEVGGSTTLTVIQDNNESEEGARHAEANWSLVLKTMKEVLETP